MPCPRITELPRARGLRLAYVVHESEEGLGRMGNAVVGPADELEVRHLARLASL